MGERSSDHVVYNHQSLSNLNTQRTVGGRKKEAHSESVGQTNAWYGLSLPNSWEYRLALMFFFFLQLSADISISRLPSFLFRESDQWDTGTIQG